MKMSTEKKPRAMLQVAPSLNALKAFEAAGRLNSFAAAAAELGVTPGAISRQINALEETLNMRLFVRGYREVRLTPEAAKYRDQLTDAFRRIGAATNEIVQAGRKRPVCVLCPMNVGMRWLLPRLARFDIAHPSVPVTITTFQGVGHAGAYADDVDVVLRLHSSAEATRDSIFLFANELVLVASPRLLKAGPPLVRPEDLAHHTVLLSAARPKLWQNYLSLLGMSGIEPAETIVLENSAMTTSAAIEGIGVTLCDRIVLADEIAAKRLVQPLPHILKNQGGFYLTIPHPFPAAAHQRRFVEWLVEEASAVRKQFDIDEAALVET
jgi:LysR family glycine cleavage system transcriptional activator